MKDISVCQVTELAAQTINTKLDDYLVILDDKWLSGYVAGVTDLIGAITADLSDDPKNEVTTDGK